MKFGLTEEEFSFLTQNLIEPLKHHGAEVFLFGSRANGKFQKFSDIDLLYKEGKNSLSDSFIYERLSFIEESSFPYKIDLVNDKSLAKSYRDSVEKDKVKL